MKASIQRAPRELACLRRRPPVVLCRSISRPSAVQAVDDAGPRLHRRDAMMAASVAFVMALSPVQPAQAGAVGDALKGVLRNAQRKDGGAKLLAPFGASKKKLEAASEQLQAAVRSGAPDVAAVTQALKAVRVSSLNCYVFEPLEDDNNETRASLITQQIQLADPCTFRLIVKNVFSFSSEEVKAQGADMIGAIIRSYALLDDALVHAMQEGASVADVEKAQTLVSSTFGLVSDLEDFVAHELKQ